MARTSSNLTRFLKRSVAAIALFSLALILVSAILAHMKERRHTVTFALVPDSGEVGAGDLRRTEDVLRARLLALKKAYRLKDVQLEPEGAERLRVSFTTGAEVGEMLAWLALRGRADFCLLHPQDGELGVLEPAEEAEPIEDVPEGYVVRTYYERLYKISRPGEIVTRRHRYLVRAVPLMRVDEFAGVEFDTTGLHKMTLVTFDLPRERAEELRQVTALNAGREMMLLVDGNAFFPPRTIQSAVAGGRVQIQGYFYNPPLRTLVKMLKAGTLPCRLEQEGHLVE